MISKLITLENNQGGLLLGGADFEHKIRGGQGGSRTLTEFPPADFKSAASAIPPLAHRSGVLESIFYQKSSLLSNSFALQAGMKLVSWPKPMI